MGRLVIRIPVLGAHAETVRTVALGSRFKVIGSYGQASFFLTGPPLFFVHASVGQPCTFPPQR